MNMAVEFEEEGKSLGEYLAILRRRKKQLLVPAAITFVLITLVALFLPPTYRSTATILIEEQEVPKDLVRSTITSFADQQIQVITQRIMTLKNIAQLVEKHELYTSEELARKPRTVIAQEFSNNVKLDVVSADVIDPRSGRATAATIAFTLAYDHGNPRKAQIVTTELVDLYLNENLKSRSEKTANTSQFLSEEAGILAFKLEELEGRLATFKEQNEGNLPELYQYNLSVVERTERQLLESSLRVKELQKRRIELQAELAQLSPYAATVLPSGERVLSDYDRLKALQSEYRKKSAVYSDQHPDVVRLKREIASLKRALGGSISAEDQAKLLKAEHDKLSELKQRYSNDHPKVISQQRVIQQIELDGSQIAEPAQSAPDNPAYVLLDTQLKSTMAEIGILDEKKQEQQNKLDKLEQMILKAPSVEKNYSTLRRDHENAQLKYREIKAKQMEAELAQNLEKGRKGERFTLVEPPELPQQPVSPNRLAIVFVGFILAGAVGIGFVVLAEAMDQSIRGVDALADVTGEVPLITVPYIYIDEEINKGDKTKQITVAAVIAAAIIALVLFHFLVKPLDVTWFILLRKLGIG